MMRLLLLSLLQIWCQLGSVVAISTFEAVANFTVGNETVKLSHQHMAGDELVGIAQHKVRVRKVGADGTSVGEIKDWCDIGEQNTSAFVTWCPGMVCKLGAEDTTFLVARANGTIEQRSTAEGECQLLKSNFVGAGLMEMAGFGDAEIQSLTKQVPKSTIAFTTQGVLSADESVPSLRRIGLFDSSKTSQMEIFRYDVQNSSNALLSLALMFGGQESHNLFALERSKEKNNTSLFYLQLREPAVIVNHTNFTTQESVTQAIHGVNGTFTSKQLLWEGVGMDGVLFYNLTLVLYGNDVSKNTTTYKMFSLIPKTETPTNAPTTSPVKEVTGTPNPTDNPTENPTKKPTGSPSEPPTIAPTKAPTPTPADQYMFAKILGSLILVSALCSGIYLCCFRKTRLDPRKYSTHSLDEHGDLGDFELMDQNARFIRENDLSVM